MTEWTLYLLETPEHMASVEHLQRIVWPDSETEVVPGHLLLAAVHNGGIAIGAHRQDELIGFVFGFPGFDKTQAGLRFKHCSHMLGVHPEWRNAGLGFALKRAQWQMVRRQGIDHITWTYDPLLSHNAHLNIARLGAVCRTYLTNEYGELRDGLNIGLPTDRFQVDWWLRTHRVERRLGRAVRPLLKLDHLLLAGVAIQSGVADPAGWLHPPRMASELQGKMMLVEIPPDFLTLKEADPALAQSWRLHTRAVFCQAFHAGYIVTDFIFDSGKSYYVLSNGDSQLD